MGQYLLAHDLGTSGNKATLFGTDGSIIGHHTYAYEVFYPEEQWAEQDPEDWWKAVRQSTRLLLAETGVSGDEVAAVSFSGQMMGCLPVSADGTPLRRAIIWADMRASVEAAELSQKIDPDHFYDIVGHKNTPSYGIQKCMWVKKHEPEIYEKTYKFLNAKDFIVQRLTGRFCTDCSDANSMDCFDSAALQWSEEIVEASGIDPEKLPEILPSTAFCGYVTEKAAEETGLSVKTKVIMGAGDGVAANVGAGCVAPGRAYCCLGTSAWVAGTSVKPVLDEKRRIVCWAHAVPGLWSPNATMQYAGGSYEWMKNTLCREEAMIADAEGKNVYELINEEILGTEKGAGNVLFLPYLLGERAPRWNPDARGVFFGITAGTTKAEMLRAVLEGIVMNLAICFDILQREEKIPELVLIGGAGRSNAWQQTIADIFQVRILVPEYLEEANSIGAAVIAGVGSGIFADFSAADRFVKIVKTVEPAAGSRELYAPVREKYEKLYQTLLPMFE